MKSYSWSEERGFYQRFAARETSGDENDEKNFAINFSVANVTSNEWKQKTFRYTALYKFIVSLNIICSEEESSYRHMQKNLKSKYISFTKLYV